MQLFFYVLCFMYLTLDMYIFSLSFYHHQGHIFFQLPVLFFFLTAIHILSFSMVINENFDLLLTDTSSAKYKTYKATIENSVSITP